MFYKNPAIFTLPAKVRSTISGLICREVERRTGVKGIETFINCGKGDDNYFRVVNELIGINPLNFDSKVSELLNNYK
jgi:hypothetical protein